MADTNTQPTLPVMYREIRPLSSDDYGSWLVQRTGAFPNAANVYSVPLTLDEFPRAQRQMPIVFSAGPIPMPIALMGLNKGINVFLDENGIPHDLDMYVPGYIRRYPFILAPAEKDSDELTLCVDPTSSEVGELAIGDPLFDDGELSETTIQLLKDCERYERRFRKTIQFCAALKSLDLLTESKISIGYDDDEEPVTYSGFLTIDEEKLRDLPDDKVIELHRGAGLGFIHAQLLSMAMIQTIFSLQLAQGWTPEISDN